jgi:HAD superfamily hydrolase (TIGR01459 family)
MNPPDTISSPIPRLAGAREIARNYTAMIIDLWGVVHDGRKLYPGIALCLAELRRAGVFTLLLSNAPRRIDAVLAKLDSLGLERDLYDALLSSGEAAHLALARRADPFHAGLGRRCYHLGPARDTSIYEGLSYEPAADLVRADFILCTGVRGIDQTVADFEPLLAEGVRRGLPMVCANPDLIVMVGDRMEICAGALAARYEELGGKVAYHGKPHAPIYAACFEIIPKSARARPIAVGDGLKTDIRGANRMGFDSLFIVGGIHAEAAAASSLEAVAAADSVWPTYAMPRFIW